MSPLSEGTGEAERGIGEAIPDCETDVVPMLPMVMFMGFMGLIGCNGLIVWIGDIAASDMLIPFEIPIVFIILPIDPIEPMMEPILAIGDPIEDMEPIGEPRPIAAMEPRGILVC